MLGLLSCRLHAVSFEVPEQVHILSTVSFCSGWILIDRSGKHFGSILCYLRDGGVALPKGRQAVQELLVEAKHFLVQGLVELCQNSLQVSSIHTDSYGPHSVWTLCCSSDCSASVLKNEILETTFKCQTVI